MRAFGALHLRATPSTRLALRSLSTVSTRPSTLSARPTSLLARRPPTIQPTRRHASTSTTTDEERYGHLPPNASLTERLKHLIKKYGWYALGVYLAIGAVDFAAVFAGINLLGAERVSAAAAAVKAWALSHVGAAPPVEREVREGVEDAQDQAEEVGKGGREGLYAMIVLAWTIHKTVFLPVRVGVTAAVTPKLVHWLRMRGWVGRDGARRAATQMRERVKQRADKP